jgi:hypothetical protein
VAAQAVFSRIARDQLRVLTLQFTRDDLAGLGPRHLVYGLAITWAVGLGRYWDHPLPYAFQALGLGSPAVMAALGLLIYAVLWPLRPARWSLLHLYTFLSLTSLPALLYAIPVERFLTLHEARMVNLWFLLAVASWRVAMLGRYLSRWAGLSSWQLGVALLLPISLVVTGLTHLNLEQAVIRVMAGIRQPGTSNDTAYLLIIAATVLFSKAAPALLLAYGFAVWRRWRTPPQSA